MLYIYYEIGENIFILKNLKDSAFNLTDRILLKGIFRNF